VAHAPTRLGRLLAACTLAVALSAAAGCGTAPASATVTGDVTLDGKPLKEGLIRFVPVDGQTPTADARIVDGKFTATVPPGEKRIEISASRVVGKQKMYDTPDSPVVEQTAEALPARYNVRSELTWTIQKGTQERQFELKSK
jgi:hypothetical protein